MVEIQQAVLIVKNHFFERLTPSGKKNSLKKHWALQRLPLQSPEPKTILKIIFV